MKPYSATFTFTVTPSPRRWMQYDPSKRRQPSAVTFRKNSILSFVKWQELKVKGSQQHWEHSDGFRTQSLMTGSPCHNHNKPSLHFNTKISPLTSVSWATPTSSTVWWRHRPIQYIVAPACSQAVYCRKLPPRGAASVLTTPLSTIFIFLVDAKRLSASLCKSGVWAYDKSEAVLAYSRTCAYTH